MSYTPKISGINGAVNGQKVHPASRQEIGKLIEQLASASGCKPSLIQDVKNLIFENLDGKSSFLGDPSLSPKLAGYYALKVYAEMLNSAGADIRVPKNEDRMTNEEFTGKLDIFLADYKNAVSSFAAGKNLTPALQEKLFVTYMSMKGNQDSRLNDASIVYAGTPFAVARIIVDGSDNIPSEYVYQNNDNSYYAMATAEEGDPFYGAIKDKMDKGKPFTSGSFRELARKELNVFLNGASDRRGKLSEVFADKTKRAALKKATEISGNIKVKIRIANQGALLENAATMKAGIEELYASVAAFYGKKKLDGLVKDQPSNPDVLSKKLQAAESALKEYSIDMFKEEIRMLGAITMQGEPPEVTFENFNEIGEWLSKIRGAVLFKLGAGDQEYRVAREYFIQKSTLGISESDKAAFHNHLQLLESGKLSYETISDGGLGVAMPVKFSANGFNLKTNLINFEADPNDPAISVLAKYIRQMFSGQGVASYDGVNNKNILRAYFTMRNAGEKKNSEKFTTIMKFSEFYASFAASKGPVINEPALARINLEMNREEQGNRKVYEAAAGAAKAESAEKIFKPLSSADEPDIWFVVRKNGSKDLTVLSKTAKQAPSDLDEAKDILGKLLKLAVPGTKEEDFDLFSAAGSFRSGNIVLDAESNAVNALKKLLQDRSGAEKKINGAMLGKAADLLLKYVPDADENKLSSFVLLGSVKAELSGLEGDPKVIGLAADLFSELSKIGFLNSKDILISILKAVKTLSGDEKSISFLRDNSNKDNDIFVLNQKYMSTLLSNIRNRIAVQDGEAAGISGKRSGLIMKGVSLAVGPDVMGDIKVEIDSPLNELVRDHPILAMKLYLHKFSNAPDPIIEENSRYSAVETVTSNDMNAYITMAWFNALDQSKKSLSDEDFGVLSRVSEYIRDGRAKISDLDRKLTGTDEVSRDVNRALQLLRDFRDGLQRLVDLQDAATQRVISQTSSGANVTNITMAKNLIVNSWKGFWKLPSFAAQTKAQNMVIDSSILTIKEQFYGKAGLTDTSIDGDLVIKFCEKFGALLKNPIINEITGTHAELSEIKDTRAFLLSMARDMKKNGRAWGSLNLNAADYKDKNVVDAKRLLQAALLLYHPGMASADDGIAGTVKANADAVLGYSKMVAMGPLAFANYALSLKSYLLQYGKINKDDSPGFSLLDDKVSKDVVIAAGSAFLEFLNELKTDKDREMVIKSFEEDPMNRLKLDGKDLAKKYEELIEYANALKYTPVNDPIHFSYSGGSGDALVQKVQKALMIFTRSVLPYLSAVSVGEDSKINFGTELYIRLGSKNGQIHILKGKEGDAAFEKVEKETATQPVNALQNQVFCNYMNFKFLMSPTIHLQMQAGLIYQLGITSKAAANGDPYAAQDVFNIANTWMTTRAQFIAFQINPLAWINPFDTNSEIWQLIKNGDISGAIFYGLFFGYMAKGMTQQLITMAKPGWNRAWAAVDGLAGRQSFVRSVNTISTLLENPEFMENELATLEDEYSGIKNWYKACRAGGKIVKLPFEAKDWAFHPYDRISQSWLARRLSNSARNYDKMMKGSAAIPENGYLLMDPAAQQNFEIVTPRNNGQFRTVEVKLSALDVYKLAADPHNSQNILRKLSIQLSAAQKSALLNEINERFKDADVQTIREQIKGWEVELKAQKEKWRQDLVKASKNPLAFQETTVSNSNLLGETKFVIKVKNLDLLASIESQCDLSAFSGWGMNPGIRTNLYIRSLENIYKENEAGIKMVSENVDANDPGYKAKLDGSVKGLPKSLQAYFTNIKDPAEKYAKLLLSNLLQQNIAGKFTQLFDSGFLGKFFLMSPVQTLIKRYYRSAKINEASAKGAIEIYSRLEGSYAPAGAPVPEAALASDGSAPAREALPKAKNASIMAKNTFGRNVGGGLAGSFLLSGIFSGVDVLINKKDGKAFIKETAVGTGFGAGFMVMQSMFRSFGRVGSWGAAGAAINIGITGYENWNRIRSLDLGVTLIGLGRTGVSAFNGAAGGATFVLVEGGMTALTKNPVIGIPTAAIASASVNGGLTYVEGKAGDIPLPIVSSSLSQLSADHEISYYFKKNGIDVTFLNPTRKDAVVKVFQRGALLDEMQANLDKDGPFKALLSASGIKKISSGSSADLNISVLQELVVKAKYFKDRTGTNEIEVVISAPAIKKYKEGSIADYSIILSTGTEKEVFKFPVILEGDPVATGERFQFEKQKDRVGLINVLMSHISIPLNEIDHYPKLKAQIASIPDGPKFSSLDAATAEKILLKGVAQRELFETLKKTGFLFTGKENIDGISFLLDAVGKRIAYINSSKGMNGVEYRSRGTYSGNAPASSTEVRIAIDYKPGIINLKPEVFDPDVLAVQSALNALGLLDIKDVNGYFRGSTAKALKDGGFASGSFAGSSIDEKMILGIKNALYYLQNTPPNENWQKTRAQKEGT
jgi:hypothetical protein